MWWESITVALASVPVLARWRQHRWQWFDSFELEAMRCFARLWHRCSSNGTAPLPHSGPAILIANHPNHSDPAFLLANSRRVLQFLHAQEYFDVFLLRRLFRRIGCIPVRRDGHDVIGLRQALRRLREGKVLCVFPQGQISLPGDGSARSVKAGAALLALRSRAPVIPVHISGGPQSRDLMRDWLQPSGGVHVAFGPPVDLSSYYGRPITHRLLAEVAAKLMHCIADLADTTTSVTDRDSH